MSDTGAISLELIGKTVLGIHAAPPFTDRWLARGRPRSP